MYYNPVKISEVDSWEEKYLSLKKDLNFKNPIILTSKGNQERNNLKAIFDLRSVYNQIKPDPTFESCESAINFSNKSKFDGLVAFGGGSVMDTAKAVSAAICTGNNNLIKLFKIDKPFKKKIPTIFIPTTHGTGSEVTKWGTIWNTQEKKKYSISHNDLYPTVAILDAKLTLSLSVENSIITILDALSHSFESIWNKNANSTSTDLAIKSITYILKNANKIKRDPLNLKLRKGLLRASSIAGLAFSNTKTAAAHSISYPLTLNYGIPHGIASSISLIPLLKINRESILEELNIIFNKTKLSFDEITKEIKDLTNNVVPFKLSKWGVNKEELPLLASQSFTKGRMDNNIVDLDESDVLEILNYIY